MNLLKQISSACFICSTLFILSSCNSDNDDTFISDPYGVVEAEEDGGQSARLVECSQNIECPKYALALFWVAADIFAEASALTIEVEADELSLMNDMTDEEIIETLGNRLENLFDAGQPKYDLSNPMFKRGLMIMEKSHKAGSIYASNELGLLYIENSSMKDFGLAEAYFKISLEKGDMFGAYNLTRLAHLQNPADNRKVLSYLKTASLDKKTDMNIAYMLGLEYFGNEEEKRVAARFFELNKGAKTVLDQEFKSQFGLSEQ